MPGVSFVSKDPRRVEGGREGARRRWGDRRIVRLDALDPTVAAAIRALVAADVAARQEAARDTDPTADTAA